MSKISIYALHLGMGGVENYLISLANILCKDNEVTIISTYKLDESPFFEVDSRVEVVFLTNEVPSSHMIKKHLDKGKVFKAIKAFYSNASLYMKRTKLNKKYIKKDNADIIITSRTFHNKLVGKYADLKTVKIATEHNYHNNNLKYINDLKNSVEKFDYLIPISKELTNFYSNLLANEKIKVFNIPFYIDEQNVFSKHENLDYVYIGRLSSEKGVLDLLSVFKIINDKNSNARLTIIGDGDLLEEMRCKVYSEGINNVTFLGRLSKSEISTILVEQTFMLLTSYTESFGIVVLEAMSFGVIPIVFDTAKGATEVLDGFNELIVVNRSKEIMANKSISLYNDKEEMNKLSSMLIDKSKNYSYDQMKNQWNDFIRSLVKNERIN